MTFSLRSRVAPRPATSVWFSLALLIGVSHVSGQQPDAGKASAARLKILSPAAADLVTGPSRLAVSVEPAALVSRVVFFVDGREVCTVVRPPFECDWDAGPSVVAHNVRVAAYLTAGGRIVQSVWTAGAEFSDKVDVDVVQVTVTVMDGRGRYVKGLPKSAFHVAENGRSQAISHFYAENVPLELVVAVDMSESMKPSVATLKKAVAEFLSAIPPQHAVTLVGFNEDVFTLTRNKTDPAERMRAVEGLSAWGSTVLYDAIMNGAEQLGSRMGRKALVVFTDGEDRGSHVTVEEVERRLQASDLTLYMIGLGRGVTSEPLKAVMERLSEPTGGRALFTERIDTLRDAFGELLQELSNQYVLGYEPSETVHNSGWRDIRVTVDGHDRVRARKGYLIADR